MSETGIGRGARLLRSRLAGATLGVVGLLLVWQLYGAIRDPEPYILPMPGDVVQAFWDNRGLLWDNTLQTLLAVLLGVGLAALFAIPFAVVITTWGFADRVFTPLVVAAQSIPKVALAPMMLVWFGFGTTMKAVVAALVCFFPIVVDSSVGLRSVDPSLLRMARSFGANRWREFLRIKVPSALPYVFAGMKTAVTLAVVGAVVGEFVGATSGLGYLILTANGLFRTDLLLAAIVALSILSFALYYAIVLVERLVIPWHTSQAD